MLKFLFLITFLVCANYFSDAHARIVDSDAYGYTEANPYKATIGSSVLNNGFTKAKDFDVTVKGRTVSRWSRDQKLHVRFYAPLVSHVRSQKLLHVIAGLGGNDMGAIPTFIANLAHREGYSVIVYPNTLTTNFSVAASRRGLVGAAAEDAIDLYHAMDSTREALAKEGHEFNEHLLAGYSHGALLAAFVNEADLKDKNFNFSRTLLINPPLNLLHGVQVLDRFSKNYGFSLRRKITVGLGLKKAVNRHRRIATTDASQQRFYNSVRLTDRESTGVIGRLLMSSLPRTILASQAVLDLGILRNRTGLGINFESYIMRFYAALARLENREFSQEALNTENSLYRLHDSLAQSSNVFLLHNADDFLLAEGDVAWMEEVFGERAVIYPRGGHLGNLYYRDNVDAIKSWLNLGFI